jgi:hypothetical protein
VVKDRECRRTTAHVEKWLTLRDSGSSHSSQTTPPPKKKQAGTNVSLAKAHQVVVPLAAPEKTQCRLQRQRSEEIHEEWKKADGRYKVASPERSVLSCNPSRLSLNL